MKKILNIIIIIIIIVSVLVGSRYIHRLFLGVNSTDTEIENIKQDIIKFKNTIDSISIEYNKTIQNQKYKIDSITSIKQTTIKIYEKAEKDFSNSNIISDDSILRYITNKIQN